MPKDGAAQELTSVLLQLPHRLDTGHELIGRRRREMFMVGALVRAGKFRRDTLDRWAADEYAMQPNDVIDSVAELPELFGL